MKASRYLASRSSLAQVCALVALLLSVLACQINVGGPNPPGPPIPVSDNAADEFENAWQTAVSLSVEAQDLAIILTEEQITSYFARKLNEQDQTLIQQPQIYFRDGAIQVYGISQRGILEARIGLSIRPQVDPEGNLELKITSADFGSLPAPQAVTDSISAILTEIFAGKVGSFATGIRIKSIAIVDGQMALVGQLR